MLPVPGNLFMKLRKLKKKLIWEQAWGVFAHFRTKKYFSQKSTPVSFFALLISITVQNLTKTKQILKLQGM